MNKKLIMKELYLRKEFKKMSKDNKEEKKRQKCEVYSRVVGFLTPVSQWNPGKKEEFKDRQTYDKGIKKES